ncbi:Hypothetical_protein [Hexamita inflata]|uniref:Hypothetical_protein n=1 Tax=Hexamita inflata TaxID=28002 RepID=A0AA86Q9E9_9EUKA|nr:Hypothetical protein HINF_LOCUS40676 [Hexamita inflata]
MAVTRSYQRIRISVTLYKVCLFGNNPRSSLKSILMFVHLLPIVLQLVRTSFKHKLKAIQDDLELTEKQLSLIGAKTFYKLILTCSYDHIHKINKYNKLRFDIQQIIHSQNIIYNVQSIQLYINSQNQYLSAIYHNIINVIIKVSTQSYQTGPSGFHFVWLCVKVLFVDAHRAQVHPVEALDSGLGGFGFKLYGFHFVKWEDLT